MTAPPGQTAQSGDPAREPAFNAPWTIVALCLTLIALYGAQSAIGSDALIDRYGLSPRALSAGHWGTLISSIFLHISWIHVLMNSAVALAFGTPVARLFG